MGIALIPIRSTGNLLRDKRQALCVPLGILVWYGFSSVYLVPFKKSVIISCFIFTLSVHT